MPRSAIPLLLLLLLLKTTTLVLAQDARNKYASMFCDNGRLCLKSNPPKCNKDGETECNGNERNCVKDATGQVVDCEWPGNSCVGHTKYCANTFTCDPDIDDCVPMNCQVLQRAKCPQSIQDSVCSDDGTNAGCPASFQCTVLGNGKVIHLCNDKLSNGSAAKKNGNGSIWLYVYTFMFMMSGLWMLV